MICGVTAFFQLLGSDYFGVRKIEFVTYYYYLCQ